MCCCVTFWNIWIPLQNIQRVLGIITVRKLNYVLLLSQTSDIVSDSVCPNEDHIFQHSKNEHCFLPLHTHLGFSALCTCFLSNFTGKNKHGGSYFSSIGATCHSKTLGGYMCAGKPAGAQTVCSNVNLLMNNLKTTTIAFPRSAFVECGLRNPCAIQIIRKTTTENETYVSHRDVQSMHVCYKGFSFHGMDLLRETILIKSPHFFSVRTRGNQSSQHNRMRGPAPPRRCSNSKQHPARSQSRTLGSVQCNLIIQWNYSII